MPFGASRSINTVKYEVLKFATGLEAIESVVLSAEDAPVINASVNGVGGNGYRAGTILTKVPGDSQNRYRAYTAQVGEAVEGILGTNVFVYDTTEASDEPADSLFHSCVFDKSKIIGFVTYEDDLREALNTSRFD
jgi:hypothetical protein